MFDVQYIIAPVGSNKWTVAKFTDRKHPDNVYTVTQKKPNMFWTDSPGFIKVGQDVKTIKLVKQFIADNQPRMTYYVYNDVSGQITQHKFGSLDESDESKKLKAAFRDYNGKVYVVGPIHNKNLVPDEVKKNDLLFAALEPGFVTVKGTFLDRDQALDFINDIQPSQSTMGQGRRDHGGLTSSMLGHKEEQESATNVLQFPDRKGQIKQQKGDDFTEKLRGLAADMPNVFRAQQEGEDKVKQLVARHSDTVRKRRLPISMAIRPAMTQYSQSVDPIDVLWFEMDEDPLVQQYIREHIDEILAELETERNELEKLKQYVQQKLVPTVMAPQYLFSDTGLSGMIFNTTRILEVFGDFKKKTLK